MVSTAQFQWALENPPKIPRQEVVAKPQLIGETCEVVVEYLETLGGDIVDLDSNVKSYETIQVPVKDTEQYVIDLLAWFSAEERAIEAQPLNDLGTKNTYKAQERFFVRIVPKSEVEAKEKRIATQLEKALAKKQKANELKLGKWTVHKDTFEEYASAVTVMRRAYQMPFDDGENMKPLTDPLRQLGTFNKRVELHKKLFKQAGVPYHDSSRATNSSWELYRLIEKRIEQKL